MALSDFPKYIIHVVKNRRQAGSKLIVCWSNPIPHHCRYHKNCLADSRKHLVRRLSNIVTLPKSHAGKNTLNLIHCWWVRLFYFLSQWFCLYKGLDQTNQYHNLEQLIFLSRFQYSVLLRNGRSNLQLSMFLIPFNRSINRAINWFVLRYDRFT